MKRRRWTAKDRVALIKAHPACHICGLPIDAAREAWEVEHVIPLAQGGEDTPANARPAHVKCHRAKTRQDAANTAKAKRREAKALGAKTARRPIAPKPEPQARATGKIEKQLPPRRSLYV